MHLLVAVCVCVHVSSAAFRAETGELDASATVLRFYYVDSPPPLSVGLFFIHNHADGSYSGRVPHGQAEQPAIMEAFNMTGTQAVSDISKKSKKNVVQVLDASPALL